MKKLFDTNAKKIIWTCILAAVLITVFFYIRGCSSDTAAEMQATSTASMSSSSKATAASASASPSASASASATATASATEAAAEQPADTETSDQTAAESQPVQQETAQQESVQQAQQETPVEQEPQATPTPCIPTVTQELVKAAWDETVVDSPAYDKQVCNVCGAEFAGADQNDAIISHIAAAHDGEGGYHDVYVPAVTHTIHHDAEYKETTSGC